MATESDRNQPVRDLLEFTFTATAVEGREDTYDLKAELRVGSAEIDESATSEAFTVVLRRVFIELDCSGVAIVPGSKLGEAVESNELKIKTEVKKQAKIEVSADSSASGKAGTKDAAQAHLAAQARLAASKNYECTESSERETQRLRVKAIGNDRWEVSEIDGSPLDGKIINNENLCQITVEKKSNAALVAGRALARQKDFKFPGASTWLKKLTNTDQKLLNVFLTKKLAGGDFSGEILLASMDMDLKN